MTFSRFCAAVTAGFLALSGWGNAQSIVDSMSGDVKIDGLTTTMDPETGLATVSGDVRVEYQDVQIRCAQASYNNITGDIHATGNVLIWKAGTIYRGDSIDYNVLTGELSGNNVRSGMPANPGTFFYSAKKFRTETKLLNRVEAEDVEFTLHDVANPNFRISGKSMEIEPGERVKLHNIKYLGGNTPLFYLPYLAQGLDQDQGYRISPGYNSRWGAFLLNRLTVFHGTHTEARYNLDLRSFRGVAGGVEFYSMRHNANRGNFGQLTLYGMNDSGANRNTTGTTRALIDKTRYRLNFQHRIYLPGPDVSTWYIDFDINKLSDIHFYEDFYFNDFLTQPEPDNQISVIKKADAFVATLMTRVQLNKFYRAAERLPELSIDFVRRPIFGTRIQHQGTISAGVYVERLGSYEQVELQRLASIGLLGAAAVNAQGAASSYASLLGFPAGTAIGPLETFAGMNLINSRLVEPGFTRFHTYHEFLYPKTFFGWLNVTPRLGAGATSYHSIDGSLSGKTNYTRGILSAGLDISFKVSKNWSDYQNHAWGLDGIRHVVQPYLNYSFMDAAQDAGLPAIDRLSATTRPRSIDGALFTAVDALRSWNVARIGVLNLLQTRRDHNFNSVGGNYQGELIEENRTHNWLSMNTYLDVFAKDPEFGRDRSNLYNDIIWSPVPWITFVSQVQLPLSGARGNFSDFNNSVTFMPNKDVSVTFGHQYLNDNPYFPQDSSRLFASIYARLTENWGLSTTHVFEADDGTMEFQSYALTRDFSSWLLSFGAMLRDNRTGISDYGLVLGFTLKELPQFNFDFDFNPGVGGQGGN
jgi:LPS-assembly protein